MTDTSPQDTRLAQDLCSRAGKPPWRGKPSEWVESNVVFDEPEIRGKFSFFGREYLRAWIDDCADPLVHDQTICSGTGVGKTISTMARTAFVMADSPARGLWVMPSTEKAGGSRNFANTRFAPMLRAMKCFTLPTGAQRHDVSGLHIEFGGNIIDFVGSNSPGQIGSNRCRWVNQDEKDKFKLALSREAGAGYLANERTKGVVGAKRYGTSTPTVEDGPIWKDLMQSDLRRRFLLCPHCARRIVLVQSQQFTVLPTVFPDGSQIHCAPMRWDDGARRADGSWDIQRVIQSTRFECPHCAGHIRDQHRAAMDATGVWLPTRRGDAYHRGYHIPSFYAPWTDFESSWGGMAKKFLSVQESGNGMRGYINSDLAEVDASQEHATIELQSNTYATQDWTAMLSVDVQKLWPHLWFVVQKWSSFKLQPPIKPSQLPGILAGREDITRLVKQLDADGIAAELLRFDARTGSFPALEFLVGRGIIGATLRRIYTDTCGGDTLDFGRWVYREAGLLFPRGGDSEIIAAGHCALTGDAAWSELREIAQQFEVGKTFRAWGRHPNRAVLVDAGYAEQHNPEVLRKCFESGQGGRVEYYDPVSKKFVAQAFHTQVRPAPVDCWIPYKGYPITKRWRINGIESATHWTASDPFQGSSEADRYAIATLEAASDYYFHQWCDTRDRQADIRAAIAAGKSYRGNVWNVAGNIALFPEQRFTIEQFHAQLNARGRRPDGTIWERGAGGSGKRRHPDHLNDCCRNMFALADVHGFFSYE